MSEYKDIILETADRVATLTLNMPDTRNSISGQETIEEIEDACKRVQYDDEVSVLIITGAGKSFSSGGNVKAMRERASEMSGPAVHLQERYRRGIQRIPLAIDSLDVPVIAAINGHAIGAGCDLAMMADIRIASDKAVFGETFLNLGIIPGDGGSWFLVRQIGYQAAAELTFTGKIVDADEALRLGMVAKVVEHDQLLPEALVKPASRIIPIVEMLLGGSWLLSFYQSSVTAIASCTLLGIYAAAVGINIYRGRVHFDCGCGFGRRSGQEQFLSGGLVLRNIVLIAAALLTLAPTGTRAIGFGDYLTLAAALLALALLFAAANQLLRNRAAINTWRSGK